MIVRRCVLAAAVLFTLHAASAQAADQSPCTFTAPKVVIDNGAGFLVPADVNATITATGSCGQSPASLELHLSGRTTCIASLPALTGTGTLTSGGTSEAVAARMALRGGMFFHFDVGSRSGDTTSNLLAAATNPKSGLGCLTMTTTEATLNALTLSAG